jgi:hypothetical protein
VGTAQIGDTKEDVGFDDQITPGVMAAIAMRAVRIFTMLESLHVVRAWRSLNALRLDRLVTGQNPARRTPV